MTYYIYDNSGIHIDTIEAEGYKPKNSTELEPAPGEVFSFAQGKWAILHEPTAGEIQANIIKDMTEGIQSLLDNTARARGYDNIISACSYAGYPNTFQAEAIAFGTWRSDVWAYVYTVQSEVEQGLIPMPTYDEVIEMLPKYEN